MQQPPPTTTVDPSPVVFDDLPPAAAVRPAKRARRSQITSSASGVVPTTATTEPPAWIPRGPVAQGIGITCLDVQRLAGSQRLGIIGLPVGPDGPLPAPSGPGPGTGKSTCCMSLLQELRASFPVICVFSGSEADNPFYGRCIPKLFIHAKVSKRGLKQFINRQRLAIGHNSPLRDALLILDDCFDHPSALDNDMMRVRATAHRRPPLADPRWPGGPCCTNRVVISVPPSGASAQDGRSRRACLPAVRRGSETVGTLHDVRHFPVPLSKRTGPQIAVRELWLFCLSGLRHFQPRLSRRGSFVFAGRTPPPHTFVTSTPHTALVILLNQGTQGFLQTVFWYRPTVPDRIRRLCHPAVWEHAAGRIDGNKLEHLALLSCCSADER